MNTFRTIVEGPDQTRIEEHRGFGDARYRALEWIDRGAQFVVVVDQTDNDRLVSIFRCTSYDNKRKGWNWISVDIKS